MNGYSSGVPYPIWRNPCSRSSRRYCSPSRSSWSWSARAPAYSMPVPSPLSVWSSWPCTSPLSAPSAPAAGGGEPAPGRGRCRPGPVVSSAMDAEGLFTLEPAGAVAPAGFAAPGPDAPLAVRMRPRTLDELIGQDHLLAPGAPLRQLVLGAAPMSVILWGPPGSGKTTIAHLVAGAGDRGLGGTVGLAPDAEDHLVRLATGDVRKALTALEAAASSARAQNVDTIDLAMAEKAVDVAAVRYDRDGDAHYDVISAFIKSLRGSDVDAALHWLARMLVAGEDPRFIARRLVIFASEDVGMADPTALLVATAAAQAVQLIGLPEAQLNLAQAVVHLATAPKSNAVTMGISAAMQDVRAGKAGPVPRHLRDAHYPGAKRLGHGVEYRYPHDDPRGVVPQQYPPDDVVGRDYYQPTTHGAERAVADRLPKLRRLVRGAEEEDS